MWEPRLLTTLWASMACYRDTFTFTINLKSVHYAIKEFGARCVIYFYTNARQSLDFILCKVGWLRSALLNRVAVINQFINVITHTCIHFIYSYKAHIYMLIIKNQEIFCSVGWRLSLQQNFYNIQNRLYVTDRRIEDTDVLGGLVRGKSHRKLKYIH
jgi:hypothetical protein